MQKSLTPLVMTDMYQYVNDPGSTCPSALSHGTHQMSDMVPAQIQSDMVPAQIQ